MPGVWGSITSQADPVTYMSAITEKFSCKFYSYIMLSVHHYMYTKYKYYITNVSITQMVECLASWERSYGTNFQSLHLSTELF